MIINESELFKIVYDIIDIIVKFIVVGRWVGMDVVEVEFI